MADTTFGPQFSQEPIKENASSIVLKDKAARPVPGTLMSEAMSQKIDAVAEGEFVDMRQVRLYNDNFEKVNLHGDLASKRSGGMSPQEFSALRDNIRTTFIAMHKKWPDDAFLVLAGIKDPEFKAELDEIHDDLLGHSQFMRKIRKMDFMNRPKLGEIKTEQLPSNAPLKPAFDAVEKQKEAAARRSDDLAPGFKDDALTVDNVISEGANNETLAPATGRISDALPPPTAKDPNTSVIDSLSEATDRSEEMAGTEPNISSAVATLERPASNTETTTGTEGEVNGKKQETYTGPWLQKNASNDTDPDEAVLQDIGGLPVTPAETDTPESVMPEAAPREEPKKNIVKKILGNWFSVIGRKEVNSKELHDIMPGGEGNQS